MELMLIVLTVKALVLKQNRVLKKVLIKKVM